VAASIIKKADAIEITLFSLGWSLATADYMTEEQKEWPDEDKAKDKDFHVAPYWLWIDENLIPIHDSEDLIEQMRGQA
jgi:hypothetical protein